MYEEIVHPSKARIYGEITTIGDDAYIETSTRECAAQEYFLRHAKEFGFDDQDIIDIETNRIKWEKDFKMKVGVSCENSDSKRGVSDDLWLCFDD